MHITNKRIRIKKFNFVTSDQDFELRGQGDIRMNSESEVLLSFFDKKNKYIKFLNQVGLDYLPLRFKGERFSLLPDYNYTNRIMLKNITKKESKKLKDRIKKKLKSKLKERFNLKGFLK